MSNFVIAEDAVKPDSVPKIKLYTGAEIPAVGLGTAMLCRAMGAQ